MWYFSWILGVSLAASFAILNGMWYEMRENDRSAREAEEQEAERSAQEPVWQLLEVLVHP